MFCKLFLVVVFLHTAAIYANQLKEIQQLYSAIEKRDLVAVQTEFRDFTFSSPCSQPLSWGFQEVIREIPHT